MTTTKDGLRLNVDWLDDQWLPKCRDCVRHVKDPQMCGNTKSDHYGHMLSSIHPACIEFIEK